MIATSPSACFSISLCSIPALDTVYSLEVSKACADFLKLVRPAEWNVDKPAFDDGLTSEGQPPQQRAAAAASSGAVARFLPVGAAVAGAAGLLF